MKEKLNYSLHFFQQICSKKKKRNHCQTIEIIIFKENENLDIDHFMDPSSERYIF